MKSRLVRLRSCQLSFWTISWIQVLTWGDINRQQVSLLPLIITVTALLPFPRPHSFVFLTKCISEEGYISTQSLKECAWHASHAFKVIEWHFILVNGFQRESLIYNIRCYFGHSEGVTVLSCRLQLTLSRRLHYGWLCRVITFFSILKGSIWPALVIPGPTIIQIVALHS